MTTKINNSNLNKSTEQTNPALDLGHLNLRKDDIRQRFVEYYNSLGFQLLPRAPMLHPSTPMSFVMSAGLVQVETALANTTERSHNKFVLVQDCFRHFDIETVGLDETHLSLFEMPGAFLFNQDGKETIIKWMWTLVTEVLKIDPQHLWVSYFGGGKLAHHEISADDETYKAWRNIGISQDRLIGLGIKDNYWVQGGGLYGDNTYQRKCGPNTELFYDLGIKNSCGTECKPGCRCGRFLEFANTLFISYTLDADTNQLLPLKDPFIETVIGTERVAMILQKKCSVFETKEYSDLINLIDQYITRKDLPFYLINESKKIIADHIKALWVLIADGAPTPGKNGRSRIIKILIRRLLTRIIVLGIAAEEFIPTILLSVEKFIANRDEKCSKGVFEKVYSYIHLESKRFQETIIRGEKEMNMLLEKSDNNKLDNSQVITLEKNFGFPFPLIAIKLYERGIDYDYIQYLEALAAWKNNNIQAFIQNK